MWSFYAAISSFLFAGAQHCECVFPYNGQNTDELTLRVGQVVRIINKDEEDAGWWKGELDGVVGVFPDNFVKMIDKRANNKKPERPPPPQIQTSSRTNDALTGFKKAISVEEKYDLGSLRKELQESNKSIKTEEASEGGQKIPEINILNEKTDKKGKPNLNIEFIYPFMHTIFQMLFLRSLRLLVIPVTAN